MGGQSEFWGIYKALANNWRGLHLQIPMRQQPWDGRRPTPGFPSTLSLVLGGCDQPPMPEACTTGPTAVIRAGSFLRFEQESKSKNLLLCSVSILLVVSVIHITRFWPLCPLPGADDSYPHGARPHRHSLNGYRSH